MGGKALSIKKQIIFWDFVDEFPSLLVLVGADHVEVEEEARKRH